MGFALRLSLMICLLMMPVLAHAAGRCERPAKPAFPDPRTVDPAVVQKLDQSMQKYAAGTNAYVACLTQEAQTAQAEGAATINTYNQKFLPEYNKRAAEK